MVKHKIVWWGGHEVYPLTATIPLCHSCNQTLGTELEGPMQKIFLDIESGKGISDNEAEIFIRWCWKMEGFSWRLHAPEGKYSDVYTVIERALKGIDAIRPRLVLAIALLEDEFEGKEYKPLGLCNFNNSNAIVVSGVISKIAFIVLMDDQVENLPINFSYYRLNEIRDKLGDAKLFYPKFGFKKFSDARDLTRRAAALISNNIDKHYIEPLEKEKSKSVFVIN